MSAPTTITDLAQVLDSVYESATLPELVAFARQRGDYCCSLGCGGGACETCPCCVAGWCVSGADGLPEDPEDRALWLAVAADHNPVAAALATALTSALSHSLHAPGSHS